MCFKKKCLYGEAYSYVRSLVTVGIDNVNDISEMEKRELCTCLIADCEDTLPEIISDPQIRGLIGKFVVEGFDYSVALQEVLTRVILTDRKNSIEKLFEDARNFRSFNHEEDYEDIPQWFHEDCKRRGAAHV